MVAAPAFLIVESRLDSMSNEHEEIFDSLVGGQPLGLEPVMLAAFEGWNDAGEAASDVIKHLMTEWDAELIHEVDPEEFHDFQVNRPTLTTTGAGERELSWPTTTIWRATSPRTNRTVLLVQGIEPSFRWRTYCEEVLNLAAMYEVQTLITVGALLADVPHTRPVPISTTSDDAAVREMLGADRSRYEGPTGIVGVLQHIAADEGLNAISLWAAVPHYVAHPPAPKAILGLLGRLEELLGETIPLADLPENAEAWENGVNELAAEDPEIAQYVSQLEEAKDTVDLPEASGDAIAKEFERYLRRRDDE